jgi:hypothetical protein
MREIVYNYKTKHKEGFTHKEVLAIIKMFPNLDLDKFYNALDNNTCMIKGKELIRYHHDILSALVCGVEKRDQRSHEWD